MPTLATRVNGQLLAQVRTDGFDVLSVQLHGTRVDEVFAELEVNGGSYPDDGPSTYLTWVASAPVQPGDVVEVTIQAEGETLHAGKTIEELFPRQSNEGLDREEFRSTSDMFAELRAKQQVRSGYSFALETSRGTRYTGRTSGDEHGFGLSVLWNSHRPTRANLSLHSYTIDSLEQRSHGRDHVNEYIEPFTSVRLRVDG